MIINLIFSTKKQFFSSVYNTLMIEKILSTAVFIRYIDKTHSKISDILVVSML